MAALEEALGKLAQRFERGVTLDRIEEMLAAEASPSDANTAELTDIEKLDCVRNARLHPDRLIGDLLALSQESKTCITTPDMSTNRTAEPPTWQHLTRSARIDADQLVAYFTCIVHMAQLRPANAADRRLGLVAGGCYMRLLSVPTDAQVYGVFHAPLVLRALGLFGLLASQLAHLRRDGERLELEGDCTELLAAVERMLLAVSLADHADVHRSVMRTVRAVLLHYVEPAKHQRSRDSERLYKLAYDLLNNLCQQRHGDPAVTLTMIMGNLATLLPRFLHFRAFDPTPIVWFVGRLTGRPACPTAAVLTQYVQAILSNATLSNGGADVLANHLEVCVQFETALWLCGSAVLLRYTVEEMAQSDTSHRLHALELALRLLAAPVTEEDFGTRVDDALAAAADDAVVAVRRSPLESSREVMLLRVVLEKMTDPNNNLRMKAMTGFVRLYTSGNVQAKEIMRLVFHRQGTTQAIASPESTDPTPPPTPSVPRGIEQLHMYRDTLLVIIELNCACTGSALVRKSAVSLLEILAHTDCAAALERLLSPANIRRLYLDTSPAVRRQLLSSAVSMLQALPHSAVVVETFARVTLSLALDNDAKIVDMVADSFRQHLFNAIQPAERTHTATAMRPWRLLRALLTVPEVRSVRSCIGGWVNRKLLTPTVLARIETHVSTDRATEAWELLSMVASHIPSRRPELVVTAVLTNLQSQDTESDILYAQLEVLACWLDNIDPAIQRDLHSSLDHLLRNGDVAVRNVVRIVEICSRIGRKQLRDAAHDAWAEALHQQCLHRVLPMLREQLRLDGALDTRWLSWVFTYAQTLTLLPDAQPDATIVNAMQAFLRAVAKRKLKFGSDHHLKGKVLGVTIVLTRITLYHQPHCTKTVAVLSSILQTVKEPTVILSAIRGLKDLYKKYASLAETVLGVLLKLTQHDDASVRAMVLAKCTFLINDDDVKFRGPFFIYVLAAMCDPSKNCSELAVELMLKQWTKKPLLLRTFLSEAVFALNNCPLGSNRDYSNSSNDMALASPLAGPEKQQCRQYVYRFLVHHIETVHCYRYFDNVRNLVHNMKHERKTMLEPQGMASLRDFFYVLAHICVAKNKQKDKISDGASAPAAANADDDGEVPAMPAASTEDGAKIATGRGGRRNAGPTMDEALLVVEKSLPVIAELATIVCEIDEDFATDVDHMGRAICEHFVAMTQFAQPSVFWSRYRRSSERSRPTAAAAAATTTTTTAGRTDVGDDTSGAARRGRSDCDVETPTRPDKRQERHRIDGNSIPSRGNRGRARSDSTSQSESEEEISRRTTRLGRKRAA